MIQHVSLETRREDGDAEVAFWALLGFSEVAPPPSLADRARWVERGGTQVHLLWADAPARMRDGHVAVVVDDFEATVEALRAAGHEVDRRAPHWGAARAYVRGPAKHLVELMAWPPGAQQA